jgi:hypothetical protein
MGFQRGRKLYALKWPEGHDNHGLEVNMRGLSVDQLVRVLRLTTQKNEDNLAAIFSELFELFASKLDSWNIEDEGEPIPATKESVDMLAEDDPYWLFGIVLAWATAIGSVDIPLPEGLSSGETSQELSTLGLESQSKSLGN